MVCRIAASLAYETFIRPFYLRHIPQTVIVILKSIIELNGIHAFKYFSSYHATKVAIIFHLGALTAYTYIINVQAAPPIPFEGMAGRTDVAGLYIPADAGVLDPDV